MTAVWYGAGLAIAIREVVGWNLAGDYYIGLLERALLSKTHNIIGHRLISVVELVVELSGSSRGTYVIVWCVHTEQQQTHKHRRP